MEIYICVCALRFNREKQDAIWDVVILWLDNEVQRTTIEITQLRLQWQIFENFK